VGYGYVPSYEWYVFPLPIYPSAYPSSHANDMIIGGLSTSTDSNASVVAKPVAAKIVSTGWPISRTGSGHFDPSRDPRLLYL
jgi:hypothetical protein